MQQSPKVILDTNVIIDYNKCLQEYDNILLPIAVCEEIDKLAKSADETVKYKARKARNALLDTINIEWILECPKYQLPDGWDSLYTDNQLLAHCKDTGAKLITNDINLIVKGKALEVACERYTENKIDSSYTGWKVVKFTDSELAEWYESDSKVNKWELKVNEYILIELDGKIIDSWVFTGCGFERVKKLQINSSTLGVIKPKDIYQTCAIDSLFNSQMVMVKGKSGSGKSLITLSYAMEMVESEEYDKLIVFTNPVATKHSAKLGYYSGSKDEKLLDSQTGNMLSSKFGDRCIIQNLVSDGKLVLLPFSDLRGYDTTGSRAIVYIMEAQNLDIELMKLAIQRVGDDCQLILDGDYTTQVDCREFGGHNNGMARVSEVFRGEDFYSEVELPVIYRSKLAEVADKM